MIVVRLILMKAKVKADALDFQDAAANLNHHANITVNSYEAGGC